MDVILLDDVEKLGLRGEVVAVAPGYARNYLLPRRLAERATPAKVAELRRRDEQRSRQEARTAEQAEHVAEVLTKTVLRFEVPAGPTGTLFGSVTSTNVADEIWRTRKIRVDRRRVSLHDPIKRIGRYSVPIDVFEGVRVEVKTLVAPEGGELPSDEELEAMFAAEEAERAAAEEAERARTGAPGDAEEWVEVEVEPEAEAEQAAEQAAVAGEEPAAAELPAADEPATDGAGNEPAAEAEQP
jgi:large subunit ribosomal protein L9